MRLCDSLPLLVLLIQLSCPVLGARSRATSFCKCVCFNNSTIIALNPPPTSSQSPSFRHNLDIRSLYGRGLSSQADRDAARDEGPRPRSPDPATDPRDSSTTTPHHKLTCADCTRAFCLDYNLPICKNAKEEDVFTTCFQRDSLKDETVVVIFIFATAGLLAWAAVKPWIDKLRDRDAVKPLSGPPPDHLEPDRGLNQGNGSNKNRRAPPRTRNGPEHVSASGSARRGNQDDLEYSDILSGTPADQLDGDIVSISPSGPAPPK